MREVIGYIKYSKDKEHLSRILKHNEGMLIDREAALVIQAVTNTPIEIPEGMEEIDMCEAIEAMLSESKEQGMAQGIEIGEIQMLVKQLQKGRITLEEAAEDAGMSVEKLRETMEYVLTQNV